jgi:hypothetical protein
VPKDLGDVLHFFLPDAEVEAEATAPLGGFGRATSRAAALPIVTVPVGERDVVRAAFAWNLTVEIARLGASATLLAPSEADLSPLWPEPGTGPVGAEVALTDAADLPALARAAYDVAVERAASAEDGGVVLVRVPPAWLLDPERPRGLVRWVLLMSTPEPRELLETYALAKRLLDSDHDVRVGVTIHGVRRVEDAQRAFDRIASVAAKHLGQSPDSYGLLVDDLHVYRAIVARRPIGLAHPQSPAARALRDVAKLLLEDARKSTIE